MLLGVGDVLRTHLRLRLKRTHVALRAAGLVYKKAPT
jgi:hypothetical protein